MNADPPAESPQPPAAKGKKFPCPSCGARLDFDPAARGLKCPFCGYERHITRDESAEVLERDYKAYLSKVRQTAGVRGLVGHANQTKCTGCGAVVLLEDNVVTDQCPFCHTHLENKPEKVEGLIEPESVLPFQVELRAARKEFDAWLGSLWFAPTELRKVALLGELTGVYVPYWTYDAMTHTFYDGERGDNYTDYETYTVRDANGNTRTETRQVIRVRWTGVSGEVQHFFDDVLVCGSQGLPEDLIRGLEPWDLPELSPFQPDYLSGFKTERYAVGLEDGLEEAKGLMDPVIVTMVRRDIGGDHQRIHDKKTRYTAVTFKHCLLPMWVAVYRYNETVYQILVNGRTGKVVGRRPWRTMKLLRLAAIVAVAIGVIAFLVARFSR